MTSIRNIRRGALVRALAFALACTALTGATPAEAQPLSKQEQACVNALAKAGRKLSSKQGTLQRSCVKDEAAGKTSDAEACIAADAKGKVAAAREDLLADEAGACTPPPGFAYAGGATAAEAAVDERRALLGDLLDDGAGLDVASSATDRDAAKCQKAVIKAVDQAAGQVLSSFAKCTKSALADGIDGAADLRAACLTPMTAEASDPDSDLGAKVAKVSAAVEKSCAGLDASSVFAGTCGSDPDFEACASTSAMCRACFIVEGLAPTGADCDLFDDGDANGSCGGLATTTTTTTSTTTSTTTTSTTTTTDTTTSTTTTTDTTTTTTTIPPGAMLIAIGDTVAPGAPEAGAGEIESVGSTDLYAFLADPGEEVFFDAVSGTGIPWRCTDENGATVFTSGGFNGSDPGRRTLVRGGWYTITVGDAGEPGTGTYSFTLHSVPDDQSFGISIGDTVSDGVPAAGAGRIESPGVRDIYSFTATAGDVVFLDEVSYSGVFGLDYSLVDANGAVVESGSFGGADAGYLELALGGTYSLTIGEDTSDVVGTYTISITAVPDADVFSISLDETVSSGVPAAGAGNIETPGAHDIYTFTATAGQLVFLDEGAYSGVFGIDYVLRDENGTTVLTGSIGGSDAGRATLALGGTYTIDVGEDSSADTGTYAFTLWSVPEDEAFSIAIGDSISDGVPLAGAGSIEIPSTRDVYTFAASAGQEIYLDENGYVGVFGLDYRLVDEDGTTVISGAIGGSDGGRLTLARGGDYTLTVGDENDDATGTYGLTIWNVPADEAFAIALGDTVSAGSPGAGAGTIETPGVRDAYTFTATAGASVTFTEISYSTLFGLAWKCVDANGTTVFSNALGGSSPGTFTLALGGTYTITVGETADDATGTYSFSITEVP